MKISFEGETIGDVLEAMEDMLATLHKPKPAKKPDPVAVVQDQYATRIIPVDIPVDIPARIPVEKPKRERTAKQLENDERLRVAAQAKKAAGTSFKKVVKQPVSDPMVPPIPPPPATAESLGLAPDEVAKNRVKTIEELQAAYANGFQKEVFELLSRFGNGAKSFRELPPEAFVPIREAIDNGALT